MKSKLGLVTATAVAATFAASGVAMASSSLGAVSAQYNSKTGPSLIIYNNSSKTFQNVQIDVFSKGSLIGTTRLGSISGGTHLSHTFHAGSGKNPLTNAAVATSSDMFQVIGAGIQSSLFGNSPDWLGLTSTKQTSPVNLAALFAVPEPAAIIMLATGLAGVGGIRRRCARR